MFKKKLKSIVVTTMLALGIGATTFATGASAATVGTDSVSITASKTYTGKQVYSTGGDFQVKIPSHKISNKKSTNPRMYVYLYSVDGNGKMKSITTWTVYGSMHSRTSTLHKNVSSYVDGSNKKAELKVKYKADFTTSFKATLVD